MDTERTTPEGVASSEGLGLAASAPKPRAWAIFTDSGNARMWTTFQPHVQKLADAEGLTVTPLYDQAAIGAAVAAERERLIARLRQIGMYECGCAQDAQHCDELADQLAMEHTGADWPDRRTTDGPNA